MQSLHEFSVAICKCHYSAGYTYSPGALETRDFLPAKNLQEAVVAGSV
jgi:hypothetical protein